MAVTVDQFVVDFPQFASTDEDAIESALATAALMIDATAWGTLADRALGLLTAHMLALRAQATLSGGRSTGNLTGVSIPSEVSYQFSNTATAASKSGDDGLKTTSYGQEFVQLRQFAIVPFRII
jgi:hypothetical protein